MTDKTHVTHEDERYVRLHVPANGGPPMTFVITKGDGLPQTPPADFEDKGIDKAVHHARNELQKGQGGPEEVLALLGVVDTYRARLRFVTGENRDVHRTVLALQEENSRLRSGAPGALASVAEPVPVVPVLTEEQKKAVAENSNPAWMLPVLLLLITLAFIVMVISTNSEAPQVIENPPPPASTAPLTVPQQGG